MALLRITVSQSGPVPAPRLPGKKPPVTRWLSPSFPCAALPPAFLLGC